MKEVLPRIFRFDLKKNSTSSQKLTRRFFLVGLLVMLGSGFIGFAQQKPVITSVKGTLVRITPRLADIDPTSMYGQPFKITRDMNGLIGFSDRGEEIVEAQIRRSSRRGASLAMQAPGTIFPNTPIPTLGVHFDGQNWVGIDPSDNNIAVGPNHVIQMVNATSSSFFKIWDKTGAVVQNATLLSAITGLPGSGDPVVIYDQLADRWILTEFGPGSCCSQLIMAVSVTPNPTGAWKIYQYTDPTFFPDYPKFSVWHNAYYATTNDFNSAGTTYLGSSVYAFDRTAMLAGAATATMVRFRQTGSGNAFYNMGTVCLEGTTPSSQNGLFIYPDGSSNLGIFELTPNFANPPASVVGPVTLLPIAAYSQPPANVAQQGSGSTINTLGSRMMFRMNFRNRGGTETIVATHTVQGATAALAAVRWYELRRVAGNWTVFQQGTLANPDGNSRWMGGISMDDNGTIGLVYDVSGTTSFPSIKYTGRNLTDPLGSMTLAEQTIVNGTAAHTTSNRWGDYNTLVSDPSTIGSFWGTSEYSSHSTHIFNFSLTNGAAAPVITAGTASITAESCSPANGVIDPNETVTINFCLQNVGTLNTTNLVGTLLATGGVTAPSAPQTYGVVVAGGAAVCKNFTFTANTTCGGTVTATIQLQDGATNLGNITYNFVTGALSTTFTENFDAVTAPALPAGWVATNASGPAPLWVTSNASSVSAPNSIFVDDPGAIADKIIETPTIAITSASASFSFQNNYTLESGFDGGVLEISVNGGAYQDIITAGGVFTANGYNGSISTSFSNPLAGRSAWTGTAGGFLTSTVTLPASTNGQNVKLRFRMGSDNSVAATGWRIDNVTMSQRVCCSACVPPSVATQPANTSVCPTGTATFTVVAAGTAPFTYAWQESPTGAGGPWNAIVNGGIYSGQGTATLTLTGVTAPMNNYAYRVVVTGNCGSPATSNAAILTIAAATNGGTVTPATSVVCTLPNTGTLTLSGNAGSVLRWESSTVSAAGPYTNIANTTNTLTYNNIAQTTWYRVLVQAAGCVSAYSATAVVNANTGPLVIVADPGTTICEGDPTRLTVMTSGSATGPGNLYAQTGTPVVGVGSQNFEPANAAFSNQGADDFTVPAGISWTVSQVNVTGTYSIAGVPTSINVFFYNNSASNLPGTLVASYPNVTTYTGTGGSFNITLPSGLLLNSGTYWVSVQVNMSFATSGQWYWNTYGAANVGNERAWQNPGGGFATPCNGWGYGATGCGVGTLRNHVFTVYGTSVAPGGIATGTFLWTPAAGLSSTTSNPVAASPMATTTYTVTVNDGAGCIKQASILITVNNRPVVTTQPASRANCAGTSATFTVAGTGTNLTYQWQVSTTGPGGPWAALTNLAPYSGVTSPTLTINPVTVAMNGNNYRCVLSGACSPIGTANISAAAVLTVNPLPVVTVTPASGCGGVQGVSGLLLTASGADSYTWTPTTGLYTNSTTTIPYTGGNSATVYAAPTAFTAYTVTGTFTATGCSSSATALVNYTPPAPTVTPNPVAMCLGDAAVRLIASTATPFSVSATTGTISIPVPDGNATPTLSNLTIAGIPAGAIISGIDVTINMPHTYPADMIFNLKAPNGQILSLYKHNTNTDNGAASIPTAGFYNAVVSSAATTAFVAVPTPFRYGITAPAGPYKADALNGVTNPGYAIMDPTGYVSNASNFNALYSVPNGTYTLAMADGGAGDLGTLTGWSIKVNYLVGVPATAATWSPVFGLYNDAAATIPYAGTARDTVWTRPTPAGVYTYQVTAQSLPTPPANPATPAAGGNGQALVTFNVTNTNAYPVTFSSISSNTLNSGAMTATIWYKATPIAGAPGAISAANNWIQFGTGASTATAGTVTQVLSGLTLVIPPGATYGIALQGLTAGSAANISYTNGTGTLTSYTNGGVTIITDGNAAYGGAAAPAAPTFNPRNFNGNILFTTNIAPCTSPARTVVVTVNTPTTVATQPVNANVCTDKVATFTVVASGSGPFSYQWQVGTNGNNPPWTNITNGGVYSGATTATLTITAPPVSMSGNFYRCIVTGAAPCASAISNAASLTVNPLPTVVITASPYTSLFPGLRTTLTSTVTPVAGRTFTWFRNGTIVPNAITGILANIDVDGFGDYYLRVTDNNGCTNNSNTITIKDSASGKCFIYPNPSSGMFEVRYYSVANNTNLPRSLTIYDGQGNRVMTQMYSIGRPYDRMAVDMRAFGKGLYWVEIGDRNGNRLSMCRVVIQ